MAEVLKFENNGFLKTSYLLSNDLLYKLGYSPEKLSLSFAREFSMKNFTYILFMKLDLRKLWDIWSYYSFGYNICAIR